MKTTTLVRLNVNQEAYEDIVLGVYTRWCMDFVSNYQNDLQKVMANAALNRYFLDELGKCEKEFLSLMNQYEGQANIKPSDALKMYRKCCFPLFNRYPKVLIAQAKATNIIFHDSTAN
jgi:hypothetical protein